MRRSNAALSSEGFEVEHGQGVLRSGGAVLVGQVDLRVAEVPVQEPVIFSIAQQVSQAI